MSKPYYLVICKEDTGAYVLATRRQFRTRGDAELYLTSIAVRRDPLIVTID